MDLLDMGPKSQGTLGFSCKMSLKETQKKAQRDGERPQIEAESHQNINGLKRGARGCRGLRSASSTGGAAVVQETISAQEEASPCDGRSVC